MVLTTKEQVVVGTLIGFILDNHPEIIQLMEPKARKTLRIVREKINRNMEPHPEYY